MQALVMDYAHGAAVAEHCHSDDQLIYAACGVMRVSTAAGSWVIPAGHALWMPAGVEHAVRMEGSVGMRTLLLPARVEGCEVIVVSGLLHALVLAASRLLEREASASAQALIFAELATAQRISAFVPIPHHPRLRGWCEAFLDDPAQDISLQQCGARLNLSARSVARLFQREVGMTFGEWHTHARVMLSQRCLAAGQPILAVALDHGYQSASAFAAMFKRVLGLSPRHWQLNTLQQRGVVR
ncbi:AraC family transcriptional regulator [Pseudomonas cremoricolorata]|uniref:AraC family transcriptional regulator n=1 Tax=Pseudomonas cremoricolorata TaxID=157783 RepID=A0A089WRR5_9PSED|nr:helix-turn-helix transcriptional regulator [Pseudomonas cremoricolorata]AIR91291.1 AraC family transcriptional regulator [Pseudomonas cremoricolorata]